MSFFLSLSSSLFPLLLSPRRQFILLTYPSVLLHHQRGKDEASHRRTGDSRQPVFGQRDGLLVADVRRSHQRAWIRPRPRTGQSGQRVHPDGFNHFPSPSSFYNLCINVSPPSFGKPPTQNHTIYIFVLSNSFLSCSSLPSYASAFHPFHWYHLCVYSHCPFLNSEACFSRPLLVRVSIAVIFRSLIVFISIILLGLLFFCLLFLLLFFLLVLEL